MSDPRAGEVQMLEPGLRCVLAPNPSPMTYHGTNTYLLGTEDLIVIDPGPESAAHLGALMQAIGDTPVSRIVVTHSHVDHSPLAQTLARKTGAPVCAFGSSGAGRSSIMQKLAAEGLAGGGEGVDVDFAPDVILAHRETLDSSAGAVEVLHTPGHMGNHIALRWSDRIFSGDLVMGWASSLVSPPDGDLSDFMASCRLLRDLNPVRLYAGHGAPIEDACGRIDWLIDHRQGRTTQIIDALGFGPQTAAELTQALYADVAPMLIPAAARNVFAHLVDLVQRGLVDADPKLSSDAVFALNTEHKRSGTRDFGKS